MKINSFVLQRGLIAIAVVLVAFFTLAVRIPIPETGGYINLGDIGVVFCALFFGGRWGAIVGAVGCAIGDAFAGFYLFIPATLLAKGLEGYVDGKYAINNPLWLTAACIIMALVYFLAEIMVPVLSTGFKAALHELPFNLAQGLVGAIGGWGIYKITMLIFPKHKQYN